MNAFFIALLFSAGAGTWVFTQLQRRTGYGNGKAALKGAAIATGICFVVMITIAMTIFN